MIKNKSDQITVSAKIPRELAEELDRIMAYNGHTKGMLWRDAAIQYIEHWKDTEDYRIFIKNIKFKKK